MHFTYVKCSIFICSTYKNTEIFYHDDKIFPDIINYLFSLHKIEINYIRIFITWKFRKLHNMKFSLSFHHMKTHMEFLLMFVFVEKH